MDVRRLELPDILEILPRRYEDDRGFLAETWSRSFFAAREIDVDWVQDNHSLSRAPFTLRGLHFQIPPFAQAKLVRVLKGRIFDVAVDIRVRSPTFGRWTGLEVSAAAFNQMFVPGGFAHGFLTLEPDTEVMYKVSAPYSGRHDRSILWSDPAIAIAWPFGSVTPILSAKDAAAPLLADIETAFHLEGSAT